MHRVAAAAFVFLGGFVVMVLEIIGARFLAKDFGGSFYVWISQIGVILVALALGYAAGGALADRFRRMSFLGGPLCAAGTAMLLIPTFTPPLVESIIGRHPEGRPIAPLWMKLDPVLGSSVVFFLPCFVLAILPPYMIRLSSRQVEHVGRISGMIYAASTVGSIAGVFISGYVLIDYVAVSAIFRGAGALTLLLAAMSLRADRWITKEA